MKLEQSINNLNVQVSTKYKPFSFRIGLGSDGDGLPYYSSSFDVRGYSYGVFTANQLRGINIDGVSILNGSGSLDLASVNTVTINFYGYRWTDSYMDISFS